MKYLLKNSVKSPLGPTEEMIPFIDQSSTEAILEF